jgi:glycosyltransferase involved in cell wall biosynthesis
MVPLKNRVQQRATQLSFPVKVAYVTDTWHMHGGGGAEQALLTLVTGLDASLFRPLVISVAGDGSSGYFRLAHEAGIPTAVLSTSLSQGVPTACLNFARLVRLVQRNHSSVVHSSQDRGLGLLAGVLARLPVRVQTTHRIDGPELPSREVMLRAVAARLATKNVAVSCAVARNLTARLGVDPAHVDVIFNGVVDDTVRLGSGAGGSSRDYEDGAPTVISVGRLVREKGVDILLKAMGLVVVGEPSVRLTVVGDGPERQSLERLCSCLKLDDHVSFVGYQTNVGAWLAGASVFVMPSRSEGMGIAAVEALAAAVPVVCSSAGGLKEVVEDGSSGLVVDGASTESGVELEPAVLAAALLRVLRDPALAHRLGVNGRRRYETHFTARGYVRRHEELYLRELRAVGGFG